MIVATIYAFQSRDLRLRFLASIGASFFALVTITSLFTKVQANWPAPTYFTLIILAAYFLSTRLRNTTTWKQWRGWFWAMIAIGAIAVPLVHYSSILLPLVTRLGIDPARADPMARARGWKMLGQRVRTELESLGPGAFVLCDDYMQAGEMAFYVPGNPKTYYAGSYYRDDPKRFTQWDIWPDRSLEPSSPLVGKNAIFVGKGGGLVQDIDRAFDRVEPIEPIPVTVRGVIVKTFKLWRCCGFKGMERPSRALRDF
jgi:hypothetical protein